MILCRLLVVREQMTPMTQSKRIAKRTVCKAVLVALVSVILLSRIGRRIIHGE